MRPSSRDYHFNIEWNSEDRLYYARCVEIPCCTGQGADILIAVVSARNSVRDYLEYREELGMPYPVPE